jgi:multisubunit Na+/H+ antiporter MnhG subunit
MIEEMKQMEKDIKKRHRYNKRVGSPLCCFFFDMQSASVLLGLFYLLPALAFYSCFQDLYRMHDTLTIIVGIVVLFKTITAFLCFYNVVKPSVWICDYICMLQTYLAYILIVISFPILLIAVMQKCSNWQYKESLEEWVDSKLKQAHEGIDDENCFDRYLKNAESKDDTAAGLFLIMGLLPIAFASLGLGIAIDFNRMAHFIFNKEVIADYKNIQDISEGESEKFVEDEFDVEEFGAVV